MYFCACRHQQIWQFLTFTLCLGLAAHHYPSSALCHHPVNNKRPGKDSLEFKYEQNSLRQHTVQKLMVEIEIHTIYKRAEEPEWCRESIQSASLSPVHYANGFLCPDTWSCPINRDKVSCICMYWVYTLIFLCTWKSHINTIWTKRPSERIRLTLALNLELRATSEHARPR